MTMRETLLGARLKAKNIAEVDEWLYGWRVNLADQIMGAILQARIEGLREAAALAGSMAERPYDNEPEFSAVLAVEAAVRRCSLDLEKEIT